MAVNKWIVILTNNSGSEQNISDLGVKIADGDTYQISNYFKYDDISTSVVLKGLIQNGFLEVNDGTIDLDATEGVNYVWFDNLYHAGETYVSSANPLVHTDLDGRSAGFQHPISAITNLQTTLDEKATLVDLQVHVDDYHALSAIHTADVIALSAEIVTVSDGLSAHEADVSNPHEVTKLQVLLGNVDDTSDLAKPVSTAQGLINNGFSGSINTLNSNIITLGADDAFLSGAIDGLTSTDILDYWTESYDAGTNDTSWEPVTDNSSIRIGATTNQLSGGGNYSALIGGNGCNLGGGNSGIFVSENSTITVDDYYSVIIGGSDHNILGGGTAYDSILGGDYNTIWGFSSTIAGGDHNTLSLGTQSCFIGAGENNIIGDGTSALHSVIAGGGGFFVNRGNKIYGSYSFIGGGGAGGTGNGNELYGDFNSIVGGHNNTLSGSDYSFIGGGHTNTVTDNYSFIGGGTTNTVTGNHSFIGGGHNNTLSGSDYSFIGGGGNNTTSGNKSNIVGGSVSHATGDNTFVGAGSALSATGYKSFVGGGTDNLAEGYKSVIVGGSENTINQYGRKSAILYGEFNDISFSGSSAYTRGNVICGGLHNTLTGSHGNNNFIGSGNSNTITDGQYSSIVGGFQNSLSGSHYSFIGGGHTNTIENLYGTIGGGFTNVITAINSTIAGGYQNSVAGADGSIGGGRWNKIDVTSSYATIAGGGSANDGNGNEILAQSDYGTIGGGRENVLSGGYNATIAGGRGNTILETGGESFIGGGSSQEIWGSNNNTIGGGERNKIFANLLTDSGEYATIGGGYSNEADAEYSTIAGGNEARTRTFGQQAYSTGHFAVAGDAQASNYVISELIASSTKTWLYPDGNAINDGIFIDDNQTMTVLGTVTARTSGDTPDVASWKVEAVISKTVADVITVHDYTVTVIYNPTSWTIDISDTGTTNFWSVGFTATGWTEDIRVVADLHTSEVIFA